MKRFRSLTLVVAVLSAFAFSSCGSSLPFLGPSMDLINTLGDLGVSPEQALGGVGAIMNLAKGKLDPADFMKVANAVPYANTIMKEAGKLGIPTNITDMKGLDKAFKSMDMGTDMVGKFIPEIASFAGKKGGADVTNLLLNTLK